MNTIKYPYLPEGKTILYVDLGNEYMALARAFALEHSLDDSIQTGAVIIDGGNLISTGANGSNYHKEHGCERVRLNIPTGQQYELCDGCNPKNHAEAKAITKATEAGISVTGMDLYLWGHWWCCEPCWQKMIQAGIAHVYLLKDSEVLFDKLNPDNIVGIDFKKLHNK